jgi:iron complex transport system ATP-binding protein
MESKQPVISVHNLTTGYGSKVVVKDINAAFYPGDLVGIIGCNGAGKSTFLKTIRGLLPKLGGEITILGKPVAEMAEKEFATQVAYLQQNVEIGFGYTGKDIVLAGRYPYMKWWQKENRKDIDLALACLQYTGTLELADQPVNQVSGGQRQRIFLAKILAQQTPILFLDEPTTGLDMVYQEEIFRFSKELAKKGKTILMVVHELNYAAEYCNRILLVGEGQVLADGKPEEVLTSELLSRAYNARVTVERNGATGGIEIHTSTAAAAIKGNTELLNKICQVDYTHGE